MLCIFELDEGAEKVEKYVTPFLKSTPKVLHEISIRFKAEAGKKYVIIPAPRNKGTLGDFYLSLYFDCQLHDADIRRIDDKNNRCKY